MTNTVRNHLVSELRRLLDNAGTDEHQASAEFDRLVAAHDTFEVAAALHVVTAEYFGRAATLAAPEGNPPGNVIRL